jgi:dihydroxyacetone kinase
MRELIIRGLAGTILVYKLAAALSEQGADLDKVEAVAKYATTRLGTLGIGLDHCHVRVTLPSARGKADK